jgi:hypothetical protein
MAQLGADIDPLEMVDFLDHAFEAPLDRLRIEFNAHGYLPMRL